MLPIDGRDLRVDDGAIRLEQVCTHIAAVSDGAKQSGVAARDSRSLSPVASSESARLRTGTLRSTGEDDFGCSVFAFALVFDEAVSPKRTWREPGRTARAREMRDRQRSGLNLGRGGWGRHAFAFAMMAPLL